MAWNISSRASILSSVETTLRTALFTLVAPIAWGSSYLATEQLLPPDRPLFSALVRALPIGLVLLAWRRELPHGRWWWRATLLGVLNIGAFFALIFLAAYRLPGGLAATLTAISPLIVMALAWPMAGERPARAALAGGVIGVGGVALLVLRPGASVDPVGLAGALGAVLVSAVGFVLVKRWTPPTDLLTFTSWQLVAGGVVLLPVALVVEGAPPALTATNLVGYAYLGVIGTGLAYVAWFTGIRRLGAGPTSLLGLVNPVVGTLLGVWVAHEVFGAVQALGLALVLGGVLAGQPAVRRWVADRRPVLAVGALADARRRLDAPRAGRDADRDCVPAA